MKIPVLLLSLAAACPLFGQSVAVSASQPIRSVLTPTDPSLIGAPYLDTKRPLEERVDDLFGRMTMLEKAKLLHGAGGFSDYGDIPRLGLPKIAMTDGPQGVRTNVPTTAMPCGLAMAATWDPDLISQAGAVMADDARATGYSILLGPAVNLMRTPLGGRTFEYMGEDPLLAGSIAAGYISGVQSQGVSACIKHWTANNQETGRCGVNVQVDERPLHELYSRTFKIAIARSGPWSIMPAYNKVEGDSCTASALLNRTLLRDEFHFDGALISDWGAWHDDAAALNAGCTIRMPHRDDPAYDTSLVSLVNSGTVSQAAFDDDVKRDLRLLFRVGAFDPARPPAPGPATPEDAAVARRVAAESTVLLKNEGDFLPLDGGKIRKLLVLGPNADRRQTMSRGGKENATQGGSGATFPPYEITPLAGLRERLGDRIVTAPWDTTPPADLAKLAAGADAILFVGGLSHVDEHEGYCGKHPDRLDLTLPGPQADIINALAKANPRIAVVLIGGGPVSVEEFQANVPALLDAWYPGMEGGRALAGILLGDVSPSGHLPVTFGKQLTDWAANHMGPDVYPGTEGFSHGENSPPDGTEFYREGMRVGYRGFAADGTRYAFGHGLSYTTFDYSDFKAVTSGSQTTLSVSVKNTGAREGACVPQFYANPPGDALKHAEPERPVRGLVAFGRIDLKPGETKTLTVHLDHDQLMRWSPSLHGWTLDAGEWTIDLGESAIATRASVKLPL